MKTLYIDCSMGAAGDMLTAALTELLPDADGFIERLNALSIPDVTFEKNASVKCGITGTHISVKVHGVEESEDMHEHHHEHHHGHDEHEHSHGDEEHSHEHHHDEHEHSHGDEEYSHEHHHDHEHNHAHHHSSMHDIEHIVSDLKLSQKIKDDIIAVYNLIAEAESHAHNKPVTEIHFHEVGTMDAVADVTAVCMLMDELSPDAVVVSPVHVGSGQVRCAHGILPVPAPATAYILKDVPIYGGKINGELCTPTGAALLKHFATSFGDMPVMKTQAIGYGMGKKDFEAANCVRVLLGETVDKTDDVLELSCNVDDMTAEEIGFATERLFDGGALEVYTVPIGMKKSRPGTLIRVMCREADRENIIKLIYKYTTTIGIRETLSRRYILERSIETIETPYGEVRRKISSGYGVKRVKYEYDDLARIARERNLSIDEVRKSVEETD
ncbi:MAG: nickel pincer cofactor biosynthesis protein LarC [Lachnospiraceae bacterium]|nr:nickel pincer cofactor biosynthesis protein LarC [Lachnospiraceae bacterium]